jgi:hypothetical protein
MVIGPSTIGYFGRTNFFIGLGIGLASVVVALVFMCFISESIHYSKSEYEIALAKEQPFNFAHHVNPFR